MEPIRKQEIITGIAGVVAALITILTFVAMYKFNDKARESLRRSWEDICVNTERR